MNDEHKLTGAYYPESDIEKYEGKIPNVHQSEVVSEALPVAKPVAWLRTDGSGSPVITEDFLQACPQYRSDFEIPLFTGDQLKAAIDKALKETRDTLWLAHEHAKLNFGGTYVKGNNVFDACETALMNTKD